MIIVVNLVY